MESGSTEFSYISVYDKWFKCDLHFQIFVVYLRTPKFPFVRIHTFSFNLHKIIQLFHGIIREGILEKIEVKNREEERY
jgi:hypothetical protein